MASEAKIKLVLTGEDRTDKAFGSASRGAKGFGSSIKGLLPLLGAVGLAGAMGSIIKQTANFEQQLSDVSTLMSGDSTQAINEMRTGIQELLKVTPKSADELGAAAYQIVSAGISDTGDAMKTLKASSKLAVAGLGTTEEATGLLVTALNAFGKDASEAEDVADILFKTVKAGQTNVAQLSQAFGKMAGNAAAAGIGLEDVQAATAALTTVTGKTSESQNALAQLFLELTVSGGKLDKALQDQGKSIEWLNTAIGDEGLAQGMKTAAQLMGVTDTQFKNMFSSAEAGTAVFQLMTSANEAYNKTLEDMDGGLNAINEAQKKQNEQFNAQYQILKNNVNVEFQKLAIKILPALTGAMQFLTETYIPYMKEAFEGLTETLETLIFKIGEAISKFVELLRKAKEATGAAWTATTDFLGEGIYQTGKAVGFYPSYAVGGTVPGPTGMPMQAIVHGGEEIIPAGQARGAGGVTVNINGGMFLDERSAEQVGNYILQRLQTQFRF